MSRQSAIVRSPGHQTEKDPFGPSARQTLDFLQTHHTTRDRRSREPKILHPDHAKRSTQTKAKTLRRTGHKTKQRRVEDQETQASTSGCPDPEGGVSELF